ncbi:MAG: nickel/cobalt transporter [Alphaproteobacteria bacterium]
MLLFGGLVTIGWTHAAVAHPLGNFSVNQYSALRLSGDAVEVRYVVDMAEIPAFQELQEAGIMAAPEDPGVKAYLARKIDSLRDRLILEVNGARVPLAIESREILFPPGAGGLRTLKLGARLKASLAAPADGAGYRLVYRDGNFPGRAGWKEVIAGAAGGARLLGSSVPETDRSGALGDYPTDLLNSPPQVLEARLEFAPPAAARAAPAPVRRAVPPEETRRAAETVRPETIDSPAPRSADAAAANPPELRANRRQTPRSAFTEAIAAPQPGFGLVLAALALAVGLGALHALEPGHGKTLVAAYLVGSRGTFKHALLLGLTVTAAHTAGVYLVGGVTLYASRYVMPERLYPWLGIASGILIAAMGIGLGIRRWRGGETDRSGGHGHGHRHDHRHAHGHEHGHDHHHSAAAPRELLLLGISGGIVPCPAALVVLLSAIALGRTGFGLALIVAFSAGLAAVLIVIGMLMVSARHWIARFRADGGVLGRWLPLASSAFIFCFGLVLTFQAAAGAGLFGL